MVAKDLPKQYNPKVVEDKWYEFWLKGKFFHVEKVDGKEAFSVVIPPPNVTDVLHLGHALNNTLQDILIRQKRMEGYEAEWLPGIDHAGIATQVVIEKNLAKEGKRKEDIGRERFLKLAWEWKEKNGEAILNQLKKIGCSCDWDRTRFTLDEGFSNAVHEVFVHLYNKNLIYRGKYVVNWCPRCKTSLSDDETEREEEDSHLWYIKYKIKGIDQYITVATTRPETMLGDTGVAVNPRDKRYKKLVGKSAILPILDRELKIIADELVDPEFGTGAVKVTPAHDTNDFDMGKRHSLETISVINPDGTMNKNAGKFAGCNTVLEPYLSEQWFVRMKPLAQPAIEVLKEGKIRFYPEHWTKVYLHWMENIHDWCISRQLWWGHRIPVWYCLDCKQTIVSKKRPRSCPSCKSSKMKQDQDVLDTWFSSWLWPFSTFGWPERTEDLKNFYPTKALFTASEIIFLWVARMVMAGLEFMGRVPFTDIYIHGTVRDAKGVKMSKSLGNGIDPLDIISKYGTDALRVSMILVTPEGQDPCISFNTFQIGRNFCNKLWNASRFVLLNLGSWNPQKEKRKIESSKGLELADRWILSRLNKTTLQVSEFLKTYRFNSTIKILYDFVWHDFCDWYLEIIKPRLKLSEDDPDHKKAKGVSVWVLDNILRLMHPFMPFITEEVWHHLFQIDLNDLNQTLVKHPWPSPKKGLVDDKLEEKMETIQNIVYAIRNIRSEMNVSPQKKADVLIKVESQDILRMIEENKDYIINLGKVGSLKIGKRIKKSVKSATAVTKNAEIFLPLEKLIDPEKEQKRLQKEIEKYTQLLEKSIRKLSNDDFLKRAPKKIIEREEAKKNDYQKIIEKLERNLETIVGW